MLLVYTDERQTKGETDAWSKLQRLSLFTPAVHVLMTWFHCSQKTSKLAKTPQPSKPMASKLAAKGSQSAPTTVSGNSCSFSTQGGIISSGIPL